MLKAANFDEQDILSDIEQGIDIKTEQETTPPLEDTPELRTEIVEAAQKIIDLQQERKVINAEIQENYERLESKGIVKAAFKTTIKDLKYDQEQRDKYDQSLNIARKACGIPIQADLFQ